ncbi:CLUMA_CG010464, isoform A [Clunio marinus]|uniref:CLUMA_CG010464, isoform A n=1 Tax=Clunio marinus TaxID=568069 RepID=A0A1J1I9Z7_9DIPT|nr:CLUMA_CG010464, isoform A [Clunio marinus]
MPIKDAFSTPPEGANSISFSGALLKSKDSGDKSVFSLILHLQTAFAQFRALLERLIMRINFVKKLENCWKIQSNKIYRGMHFKMRSIYVSSLLSDYPNTYPMCSHNTLKLLKHKNSLQEKSMHHACRYFALNTTKNEVKFEARDMWK